MLVIGADGVRSIKPFPPAPLAHCIFEHVYFARPDSYVFGQSVNEVRTEPRPAARARAAGRRRRRRAGARLGRLRGDGLRRGVGHPAADGAHPQPLRRAHLHPAAASIRHFGVKVKLNPVRSILEGKRVVLVDDSIVRGTTSRKIVKMVRAAGAKEVHVRISCPPTISPCFYGVDTPRRAELIAATHTLEEIRSTSRPTASAISASKGCWRRRHRARLLLQLVLHGRLSRWRSRATKRATCSSR